MVSTSGRGVEVVLLFTAFVAAAYGFGIYLFPAMVEPIRGEIGFTYGTMGTISGLVQAGFMAMSLLAGLLTVRLGAMPLVLTAVALCAAALAGLSAAPNVAALAVLLTLLGGCAAAIWVPMIEIARAHVPARHLGKALGLMSSGTSYGVFVNSLLLTSLLASAGWRAVWLAASLLVVALALLAVLRLGRMTAPPPRTTAHGPLSTAARLRTLPRGLTAAVLFMMFLNGLACMPFQTYLSAYVHAEAGHDATTAAQLWRTIGLVGMASGFGIGWLADRITVRLGLIATYLILALACVLLVQADGAAGRWLLQAAAVCFGLSFYAVFGLVPAYISHAFGTGAAALVFALGNVAVGLGGIAGNLMGGSLKTITGSFEPAYWVMLAAALCSALLSALMPNERSRVTSARSAIS